MKAYALLRLPNKDIPLTTKEVYIGRDPTDTESELVKQIVATNKTTELTTNPNLNLAGNAAAQLPLSKS